MAREQLNLGDVLPLLESSDLHELDQIRNLINENLSSERGSVLLNGLVDYYLETSSSQAMDILSSVREPHDKQLLDKLSECMTKQSCRLPTLTLLGHIIRRQPPWTHKVARFPLLPSLLKCLKTDADIVVLITGVLVLIILLPVIPQVGKQHLYEFFDIFGRLAAWNSRNPGRVSDTYLIHLHASVYSLFHRLYGMYPCNFVSYLRSHYTMKENVDTFEQVVKPMLEHVRIHPELVTGTKERELDHTRWKSFESHDIVIECAKVSLDTKEASCEEGYSGECFSPHLHLRLMDSTASPCTDLHSSYGSSSSTPRQPLPLPLPSLSSLQASFHSPQLSGCQSPASVWGVKPQNGDASSSCESKDQIWSPSSICGMTTPPSSRGISPTSISETSHSGSHLPGRIHGVLVSGKWTPSSNTPGTSASPITLSDEFVNISLPSTTSAPPCKDGRHTTNSKPSLVRQESVREMEKDGDDDSMKTMTLTELSVFLKAQELDQPEPKERDEDAITEELRQITEDQQDPSTLPFYHAADAYKAVTISTPDKPEGLEQQPPWSLQPGFTPIEQPLPGHFFHSPIAADEMSSLAKHGLFSPSPCRDAPAAYEGLFDLALPRAASLFVEKRTAEALQKARRGDELHAQDGDVAIRYISPLELLDQLMEQGCDAHYKMLKRLPFPSKSADWTTLGGPTPLDELHMLRSQLFLLQNRLLYERYKREQHAVRNRRLLRRIFKATALEEQNSTMKDQLKLQDVEIQSLQICLQEEQQRYRQLWEDREAAVMMLHAQTRQLQQERDVYQAKHQELQSKLRECQKKMGHMEAELQKANNKVCNTGHQLSQLAIKLTNSEALEQRMAFLNKQLLLLGEANKLCMAELQQLGTDTSKESEMLRACGEKELEKLRQIMVQKNQQLEAAQQRIAELEAQLIKKEHLIAEQKLFLEDVKSQARGQLQASEGRYQAQRRISQKLQSELLQIYSRLETECPIGGHVSTGSGADVCRPSNSRPEVPPVPVEPVQPASLPGPPAANDCTLSPENPPRVNGSAEPPSHLLYCSGVSSDTPLTVGSYPSAKSFLGMRARELFRNKSESQCDDELPCLAGLSQTLKTEQCVELPGNGSSSHETQAPPPREAPMDAQVRAEHTRHRQQQLRIMDYNEVHHEQS